MALILGGPPIKGERHDTDGDFSFVNYKLLLVL